MTAWTRRLAVGALLAGFSLCVALDAATATAADDKKPAAIDVIMKKVNGKKGLVAKVEEAGKGEKWDDAGKDAAEIKKLTADLGKNDPPKGDKDNWAKLSKKYAEQGAAIADAVEKKDAKALATAVKSIKGGCKECHDTHQNK
jgi:cytochrome c556